ncbi:reverse transcriptase domain-containing protein [Paenibacillus sp. FSL F4-0243]|uniref:reverse transcriptase domain-containing protein n=1 Tax=Paenibacillus sp. FSL F4-0243 TaxID=2954732 RepID=UPI0030D7334C
MLEKTLREMIEKECDKLGQRYHDFHNSIEMEYQRNKRRVNNPPNKEIKPPEYWEIDKKFNPFYVKKHSKQIAHSLAHKLESETYTPHPPYIMEVDKKDGGKREVAIFQIPDSVVSKYIYKRLTAKNRHRFSSTSYAYRDDRNVHFAIQDISIELMNHPRVFVAEFDFKNFFGSLNHEYLYSQLNKNGFIINPFEKYVISRFLTLADRGVPQGTSISLFLANLACWRLDRSLEDEGLRFARYADDTVIWSNSYEKITKAYDIIHGFSLETGIEINFNKSDGISLLCQSGMPAEFGEIKYHINFLGYKLSGQKTSIKEVKVLEIKKQISYILYRNLIQPIKPTILKNIIIPNNNEDPSFVTAIMQIRRYLYGNLNEQSIRLYLSGQYNRLKFKGLMSFYPLINDEEQLAELDGWLVSTILHATKLREKILLSKGYRVSGQFPFNLNKQTMLDICKKKKIKNRVGIIQIPSFTRIYHAIQRGIENDGIEYTMNPKSNIYNY